MPLFGVDLIAIPFVGWIGRVDRDGFGPALWHLVCFGGRSGLCEPMPTLWVNLGLGILWSVISMAVGCGVYTPLWVIRIFRVGSHHCEVVQQRLVFMGVPLPANSSLYPHPYQPLLTGDDCSLCVGSHWPQHSLGQILDAHHPCHRDERGWCSSSLLLTMP